MLARGERELERGESEAAFATLSRAAELGVGDAALARLAVVLPRAARLACRHAEALPWVERWLAEGANEPGLRARLLHARIALCRQIDLVRVLSLADEALAAATDAAADDIYASLLAHAAFAAYRTGDAHAAGRFASRVGDRATRSPQAELEQRRAAMFAACARGDVEASLAQSLHAQQLAVVLGLTAEAANESNNLAEMLLELGRPDAARAHAERATELARVAGHRQVEAYGSVMAAVSAAESGDVDRGLERLAAAERVWANPIFAVDSAAAEAFWLLERGRAGDVVRAREVAERGVTIAAEAGVANQQTVLWSQIARCREREHGGEAALDALERARCVLDQTEPRSEHHLALALAEVLTVDAPRRRAALNNARSRILRSATRRARPRAFCVNVRLHRRLLELSGGVPSDLL